MPQKNTLVAVINDYYNLTKPGIVYGNAINAIAGFFLASPKNINLELFVAMLFGLSLVIAGNCVANNYIDRDIDKMMERTKDRILVEKLVSERNAIIYAIILIAVGLGILFFFTSITAFMVTIFGVFFYLVMYSYFKRRSEYGTIIGSLAGAVPPVIGYTAVSNKINLAAILLFLVLVFWQMPHFYSIGIRRFEDYKNAKLPILPISKGIGRAKVHILVYIHLFIVSTILLYTTGYTGIYYLIIVLAAGLYWLFVAVKGFLDKDNVRWAKRMFFTSLVAIMTFSIMLVLNSYLP